MHSVLAWVLVASSLVAAALSLMAHGKGQQKHRLSDVALSVNYVGFFAMGLTGAILSNEVGRAEGLHELYGYFTLFFITFFVIYKSQLQDAGRYYQLNGLGSLFLFGMALRGIYL